MKMITFPFRMLFSFIAFLFTLMGRLISLLIGFALSIAGLILIFTGIAAFIGIPILLIGILLALRAIF